VSIPQYDDLIVDDHLLRPGEVAELFNVNPKTVTRWANAGRLRSIRTLGGHHRFRPADLRQAFEDSIG
jgi:excisionase family DNA binding protein